MFDLERAISNWRGQMLAAGIKSPWPLEELETHLREEIARQVRFGAGNSVAFFSAVAQVGDGASLAGEFMKNEIRTWPWRVAVAAWSLFVVSFFLPSYGTGLGWACACISATAFSWSDLWSGNSGSIHLASLTLANLLMLASPWMICRGMNRPRLAKWFRYLSLAAMLLVWSFVGRLLLGGDRGDLKIGCFVWATSFALLSFSVFGARSRVAGKASYV
jgi:hypothetical protein